MSYLENLPGICFHKISEDAIKDIGEYVREQANQARVLDKNLSAADLVKRTAKITSIARDHNRAEIEYAKALQNLTDVTKAGQGASQNIFLSQSAAGKVEKKLMQAQKRVENTSVVRLNTDSRLPDPYRGHFLTSAAQEDHK